MIGHPNRSKAKTLKLTGAQRRLLVCLIDIMAAGEWSAGDYCFNQQQFDALQRARDELRL